MEEGTSKRKISIWTLLAGTLFVLLFVVFIAHAIWGAKAKAALDRQVAALVAAGEPMSVADFAETPLPDGRNIVSLLSKVSAVDVESAELSQRDTDLRSADPHAFEQPLTDAEVKYVRDQIETNAAALALLRGADQTAGAFWNDLPGAFSFTAPYTAQLGKVRSAANLLADDARLAIHENRVSDVLADVFDIHAVGRATERRPGVIGNLVTTGVDTMAADLIQDASATLPIQTDNDRAEANKLIARLLDDARVNGALRDGLRTERVMLRDAMIGMIRPPAGGGAPIVRMNGFVRYATTPALYANISATLDLFGEGLKLVDLPSQKAVINAAGPLNAKMTAIRASSVNVIAGVFAPGIDRYLEVSNRLKTNQHLAAVGLAIRLYASDNNGALPPSLDALVPKYLPAVPLDAMDGAALRYDSTRAILWSVGADQKDDNGDESTPRPSSVYGRWLAKDVVVHLRPVARTLPPKPEEEDAAQTQPTTQP